jgi:hypothetical protein
MLPTDRHGFAGAHAGETIWVIGSGASLDYIDRGFWDGKTCVCVNRVGITLQLDQFYTVTHYHRDAMIVANARPDLPVITPTEDLGATTREAADREPTEANIYRFPTGEQRFSAFDAERDWPTDPGALVVGPTSLHMTMHFAHHLGARALILVGADCGTLGQHSNFTDYPVGDNPFAVWQSSLPAVAEQIRRRGTAVHSLNPFVNFGLEGVPYRSPAVSIN